LSWVWSVGVWAKTRDCGWFRTKLYFERKVSWSEIYRRSLVTEEPILEGTLRGCLEIQKSERKQLSKAYKIGSGGWTHNNTFSPHDTTVSPSLPSKSTLAPHDGMFPQLLSKDTFAP
jgi:hypothetical protein